MLVQACTSSEKCQKEKCKNTDAEQRYWQALAMYIDGADHQRQKVVETRLKAVVSLVSPVCKQACDAYDALATNEEMASFARNRGASAS